MIPHNGCRSNDIAVAITPAGSIKPAGGAMHISPMQASSGETVLVMVVDHSGDSTMLGMTRAGSVRTVASLIRMMRQAFGRASVAEALEAGMP